MENPVEKTWSFSKNFFAQNTCKKITNYKRPLLYREL